MEEKTLIYLKSLLIYCSLFLRNCKYFSHFTKREKEKENQEYMFYVVKYFLWL